MTQEGEALMITSRAITASARDCPTQMPSGLSRKRSNRPAHHHPSSTPVGKPPPVPSFIAAASLSVLNIPVLQ